MKVLYKLWPYVRPYKFNMTVVILTGVVLSVTTGAIALLVKSLLQAFENKDQEKIFIVPLVVLAVYTVHGVCRYFHTFLLKYSMDCVVAEVRKDLQKKYLKLNLTYHFNYRTGGAGLLSQTLNDVNIIINGLIIVTDLIREPLTAIILLGTMVYLDWKLTLFSILFIPLLFGVIKIVTKGLRKHSTNQLNHLEDLSSAFKETLDGIRIIQSYNLAQRMIQKLQIYTDNYVGTRRSIYRREEASGPLSEFVGSFIFCAIAIYVGHNIVNGETRISDFIGFLTAAYSLQPSIKKLQSGYVKMQQCIIATERVMKTLADPNIVHELENPKPFPVTWEEIEFRNVTFRYKENVILDNFSIKIKKGSAIALIGESGSGKSTIINLLMRFFEPNEGSILVGGIPIDQFSLQDLRQQMALVSQDTFLFNETVEQNILNGDLNKNGDVLAAAKSANAHNFIEKLDNKYQTKIGERGNLLSGGEKQRLSIARAFYKDAPILILDEATSALDSVSEQEVQKGIDSLMQGRTAIVIAHRLSTIMNADQIFVLSQGKIIERGDHQSLMAKEGEYFRYFSLQANV